jgi:hypothetical protein
LGVELELLLELLLLLLPQAARKRASAISNKPAMSAPRDLILRFFKVTSFDYTEKNGTTLWGSQLRTVCDPVAVARPPAR